MGKKQAKALSRFTLEQAAAEERSEMATQELLDLAEKCAEIYKAKQMPAMALECLCFAYAHGRNVSTEMDHLLSRLGK
jgi:hypothetical protein